MLSTLPRARLSSLGGLLSSPHLLIFLDCDGTLAPIVAEPSLACIPPDALASVASLACLRDTSVCIVSGRGRSSLQSPLLFADTPGLSFASSHGHFIELSAGLGGGTHVVGEEAKPFLAIAQTALCAWLPGAPAGLLVEDTGLSLSLHYRNMVDPNDARLALVEAAVDEVVAASRGVLEKRAGKCVWELRPRSHWGKGEALAWVLSRALALHKGIAVLAAGDDVTDEDLFRSLRQASGVACFESVLVCPPLEEGGEVGAVRATAATSFVSTPAELALLLHGCAQARTKASGSGARPTEGGGAASAV